LQAFFPCEYRINPAELVQTILELAQTIGVENRRGVGDTKREEVRFLILSGRPHGEVMRCSAVSSVNTIRQEMGEATPFIAIPNRLFAGRESGSSDSDDPLAVENIGGPVGLVMRPVPKRKPRKSWLTFIFNLASSIWLYLLQCNFKHLT
jgi:hypothetical protein